ncbi:MAG: hypothetical protein K8F91_02090 [Candidatus Obscuribacterales bacterium]|nr:hypothetical protein [Candidatus Obscuribacterales bacterium]
MVLPFRLIEPVRRAKSIVDRHESTLEQLTLASFIEEGYLDKHMRKTRIDYASSLPQPPVLRRDENSAVTLRKTLLDCSGGVFSWSWPQPKHVEPCMIDSRIRPSQSNIMCVPVRASDGPETRTGYK